MKTKPRSRTSIHYTSVDAKIGTEVHRHDTGILAINIGTLIGTDLLRDDLTLFMTEAQFSSLLASLTADDHALHGGGETE